MNILLINHYAGSPRHGMEYRPYYLAREWVRMGHRVQILAASYSHLRTSQPENVSALYRDEQIDGIEYRWYKTSAYSSNGIRRVLSMLQFLRHVRRDAAYWARTFRPDVVIASSTYPMDIRPARRIARMAGARLVYEVHDLWPLSPMELGHMSRWHPFILWVQRAEDYAYRHADTVVSLLPNALDHMRSRGMAAEKFVYVPNGVYEPEWSRATPIPPEAARQLDLMKAAGLPIVGYIGTHGLANALDVLLDAARLLRGKAQFLLVGPGPDRERLLARVKQEELNHVVMLPFVPRSAVPGFLAKLDIAYIGWQPNPLYRFGISPNKLNDYMMAGIPIVHSVNASNDPVAEVHCGLTVAPGDPGAVAEAILKLATLPPADRETMGENGRNFILRNQTYSTLAQRFLSAVNSH